MKKSFILFTLILFTLKPLSWGFDYIRAPRMKVPAFYPNYNKVLNHFKNAHKNHPKLVRIVKYGYSASGLRQNKKNLFSVEIYNSEVSFKNSIIIHSLIHPRELLTLYSAIKLSDFILERASKKKGYWYNFISTTRIILIPIINPDGYEMVQKGWNWRKNTRIYKYFRLEKAPNSYGVNINQNFDVNFMKIHKISSLEWGGPYPFSEPETRYLKEYLKGKKLLVSIALHSFGKYISFPWWGKLNMHISDYKRHAAAGKEALKYFPGYTLKEGCPYIVPGNYGDWVYKNFKALTFTVEIGNTFNPGKVLALRWHKEAFKGIIYLISRANKSSFTPDAFN